MSLNVNRNVTDAFYRYKMPKLLAKVEGKGNGIKTVIVNMSDVAKAIGCPPTYPCKFFGCELGAQTQFNFKDDRYIVNGSHEAGKLQTLLDTYIRKFVLCNKCENPETTLLPNEKKQTISQTCKACGHQAMLDMRHRLTTFILKNPPDVKPATQGASQTKRKDRTKKDSGEAHDKTAEMNGVDEDDDLDLDLDVDTSDAAVKQRMEVMCSGVKHLTVSNHVDKSQAEKLDLFYQYCKLKRDEGVLHEGAPPAIFKDISDEAEQLDLKESKAVMALIELLFDQNAVKQLMSYRNLLLLFTRDQGGSNPKAQKYLLGAMEKLVELHKTELLPKVPHILKVCYERDILEEEVILEWGKKASKKYVPKELSLEIQEKAAPFVQWLKDAEEESEEEGSEEDDVEIGFSSDAKASTLKEQEAAAAPPKGPAIAQVTNAPEPEEDDSDIDIDDI